MFLTNLSRHESLKSRLASCVPGPRQIETAGLMTDILNQGATLKIKATGQSMHPFVEDGDIVVLVKRPVSSLKTGDLVLARTVAGAAVLHRVVQKYRGRTGRFVFKTQGDALMVIDDPVAEENIMGKAVAIEKTVGHLKMKKINLESTPWKTVGIAIVLFNRLWGALYYAFYLPAKRRLDR